MHFKQISAKIQLNLKQHFDWVGRAPWLRSWLSRMMWDVSLDSSKM